MKRTKIYPTVTSVMYHPLPKLRARWKKEYGKDKFSFHEALHAQSFPKDWIFPPQKSIKWKWLAEAMPPKVAEYLFRKYVKGSDNILLDLFAGIGGWSLGAIWSGKVKKIIMVEIDKKKCLYLKHNFSRFDIDYQVICKDVRKVDYTALGRIDIITASPPCEDLSYLRFFSKNNKTRKGTIPLTIFTLDLVNTIKPKIAFYENVYRRTLRELLESHGWFCKRYDMSRIIPQRRIRLIGIHLSYR